MSADWIISAGILITLALAIWAKISNQTIPELLGGIRDFIRDTSESKEEYLYE